MAEDSNSSMMGRVMKWVGGIILILLILAAIGFWYVNTYVVPDRVEEEVRARLGETWQGEVEIGQVDAGIFQPVTISSLRLLGPDGNQWVRMDQLRAEVDIWEQKAKSVNIKTLDVTLYAEDGQVNLPIKPAEDIETQPSEPVDIPPVFAESFQCQVVTEKGQSDPIALPKGSMSLSSEQQLLKLDMDLGGESIAKDVLKISGTVDPGTAEVDIAITGDYWVSKRLADRLGKTMGAPKQLQAQSRVVIDLDINGKLNDFKAIRPEGDVRLRQLTLATDNGILVDDVSMLVHFTKDSAQITPDSASVEFAGGRMAFMGRLVMEVDKPFQASLFLNGSRISMRKLTTTLGWSDPVKRGSMSFRYSCNIKNFDANTADGEAVVFMEEVDTVSVPLLKELFQFVGVPVKELTLSDVHVAAKQSGSVLTIQEGKAANTLSALYVEKGGTVDVNSQVLNFYVVGVPLKDTRDLLLRIPLVNLLVQLKDRLVRLRVKGEWSKPPAQLISKQPVEDVATGALNFLKGVAKTGGDIVAPAMNLLSGNGKAESNVPPENNTPPAESNVPSEGDTAPAESNVPPE
ncbi:MAG: hypothetical protein ACLFVU_10535 [Phycisphaerae bacterium]